MTIKTKAKAINFIVSPPTPHWVGDGFKVHNFIPSHRGLSMQDMDPFIMLDYNARMAVEPHDIPRGVGVHPHRGFETVTIAYSGEVEHSDSAGNSGIIRSGDVQWMTAAGGVLHKEHYGREWAKRGGYFQMVQLWVNLPAKDKMSPPSYQSISQSKISKHLLPDGAGLIEVISGSYQETQGVASTRSPIHLMNARLNQGGQADFSFPEGYTTAVLVLQGDIHIQGQDIATDQLVKFGREGETFQITATAPNTIALVMSGVPLGEPIIAYGPFVMNTKTEIRQAFEDFNRGLFGFLED